jgi:hypothetical protein
MTHFLAGGAMSQNLTQENPYAFAFERQARDRDNAEWAEEVNALQANLLLAEVEREVSVAYVTALRHALKDVAPSHRLLDDKFAIKMFEQTRAAAYAKRGYMTISGSTDGRQHHAG